MFLLHWSMSFQRFGPLAGPTAYAYMHYAVYPLYLCKLAHCLVQQHTHTIYLNAAYFGIYKRYKDAYYTIGKLQNTAFYISNILQYRLDGLSVISQDTRWSVECTGDPWPSRCQMTYQLCKNPSVGQHGLEYQWHKILVLAGSINDISHGHPLCDKEGTTGKTGWKDNPFADQGEINALVQSINYALI